MALKGGTKTSVMQSLKDKIDEWRGLPSDAMRKALEVKTGNIAHGVDISDKLTLPGPEMPIQNYSNVDNMLDIKTTGYGSDRTTEQGRQWLERAKTATSREDVQKLLNEDPFRYKPAPGEMSKVQNEWLEEWGKHHPPLDETGGTSGAGGSASTDSSENYVDEILGGNKPRPGPSAEPPKLPEGPVKVGGEGGGEVEIDFGKLKGGGRPKVEPKVEPKVDPPEIEAAKDQPPSRPPENVDPPKPPGQGGGDAGGGGGDIGPGDVTPGRGTPVPPEIQHPVPPTTPPAGPPAGPSGPSLPSIPLAPLAPLVIAAGKEGVKIAGKEIAKKVIGVVVVVVIAVAGTKVIYDAATGKSTPVKPGQTTAPTTGPVAGGKFSGVYAVSERDRNGTCPEGTPFRKALAAGQAGPTFNYNVRVFTGAGRVTFGPSGGGTAVFAADLAADNTFKGPSGGEYPVIGKFKGGSGPGTTFDLEWTVRYGAGSCTTDLFGQFTSS